MRKPRLRDFWTYVNKTNDCWLWTGRRDGSFGYGMYKTEGAHRVSYRLAHGGIPVGAYVLHSCDTPACVNPDHLRVGTQADNMRDRKERDRVPYGEAAGSWRKSVLTTEDVRAIRADPRSTRALAPVFGVSPATIGDIRRGRTWRWV